MQILVRRTFAGIFTVAGVLCWSVSGVLAQTPPSELSTVSAELLNSEAEVAPVVFDSPSQNARIASLQQLYAQQLEAYRASERQYQLAKSQHAHLQSLTSLEEAVKATKAAMQRRADVLITYEDLLYATLQDTLGLELSYKEFQSKQLEQTVAALRKHRQALDSADSRDLLREMTLEFVELFKLVQEDSERTRSMIVLGRMQSVYDKSQLIRQDIKKLQESYEVSALKKAERERAYTEIDRQFQTTNASLRTVREEIGLERNRASYSSVSTKLSTISSSIGRILSYLDEVLRM
jgi:hypothetical protein